MSNLTLLPFTKKMPVMCVSYSLKSCVQLNVSGRVFCSCSKMRNKYLRSGIVISIWCVFFYLQDNFGRRGILIFLCAILTIPVYGFLAFAPSVHPLVPTIWLGFTYSIAAVSLRAHKSWHNFFVILLIQNNQLGNLVQAGCSTSPGDLW